MFIIEWSEDSVFHETPIEASSIEEAFRVFYARWDMVGGPYPMILNIKENNNG